jgi:hypothetical protein
MKSENVDRWLQHWLKLQKKGKRALVVKDPTAKSSQTCLSSRAISKRKHKRQKVRNTNIDMSDDSDMADTPADGDTTESTMLPSASRRPDAVIRISNGKGKRANVRNTVRDSSDGLEHVETSVDTPTNGESRAATSDQTRNGAGSESAIMALPESPLSMSENHSTRRIFLESLSTDVNYRKMLYLLDSAPVSRQVTSTALADTCPA